jgi:TetR/AcrR family transcriptional regulator
MPKPVRPRDANTSRQAILDAAENEFANLGFGGARIDKIAQESGYNKSLIFQYFTDKANLYSAVINRIRERLDKDFLEQFGSALSEPLDQTRTHELIAQSIRLIFNQLIRYPNARRLFAWSASEGWNTYNLRLGIKEPSLEFGRQFLQHAQQMGWIRQDINIETIVMMSLTMPQAMISALPRFTGNLAPSTQSELEALREQLVSIFLNALTP